ncbi:hypothetical protein BGI03_09745 [Snodgrassella alvi]|uniref:ABC transporter permease subunit n=1 Tax=Snodgrassella alvi TaxID=1196083 RepID=UPI0009FCE183|nr:ABC transporter permease subunit [Snodgrassella alvi]ORF07792.1 hypothetical protein BGH98_03555 [Snodgrassella alvi]ORF11646.1 hypothetical protein BGI01_08510 [Snodgrassella alvi]ORF16882.1 hypothetical protein BGI03_09745 [Snodgrassella alvi]ORF17257.1 hypothetical protein BGI04_10890 [Snodgrassella alvi]
MKLLINEWRKYLKKNRNIIIIPIILLLILIIYFSTITHTSHSISKDDSDRVFLFSITICYKFINFISIIYASNILSSEISKGTVKFILTRPYQRYKILLAKLAAITILMPVFLIISVIISLLLHILTIHQMPEISIILKYTGIHGIFILAITIFFTAFALMLSSVFNSSALITGSCIVYYFFASGLWRIINFYYLDLPEDGWIYKLSPLNVNSYLIELISKTVDQSVQSEFFIILAANIVYALIFLLIATLIFRRRDISLSN